MDLGKEWKEKLKKN